MVADRYYPRDGSSAHNNNPINEDQMPIKDITDTFLWSRSHYLFSHVYAAIHEQRISSFIFISAR